MVKEFIEENASMKTKDFQIMLQKQVDAYKEKINQIETLEELDNAEKEILAEMDEYDKFINEVSYELPESVEFEGKKYSRSDVEGKFIYYLSNCEQTWDFVPTIYALCMYWKNPDTKSVSHGVLDSTIRILGQLKFKGLNEYRDLMMIDRYLDPLVERYGKSASYQIAMGHRHNAIMQRRTMLSPVSQDAAQEERNLIPA